jgi:peptide/nickel transport system permease protein
MARRSPTRVIGGRLLQAVPVILLATFMVFALLKLVPGDIAVTLAGDNATDARITEIRKIYGLDRPFLVQYGAWLAYVMQGDLSQSLLTGEKVAVSIARAFPNTLLIVVIALVLALLTGIPMGVIAAIKPNGWVDKTVSMIASLGVAIPGFWLAMILVAEISLKLNWLPATAQNPSAPRRSRRSGTRCCPASPLPPMAWRRWRGSCAARSWKCCRRNMCGRCTPRGCQ